MMVEISGTVDWGPQTALRKVQGRVMNLFRLLSLPLGLQPPRPNPLPLPRTKVRFPYLAGPPSSPLSLGPLLPNSSRPLSGAAQPATEAWSSSSSSRRPFLSRPKNPSAADEFIRLPARSLLNLIAKIGSSYPPNYFPQDFPS